MNHRVSYSSALIYFYVIPGPLNAANEVSRNIAADKRGNARNTQSDVPRDADNGHDATDRDLYRAWRACRLCRWMSIYRPSGRDGGAAGAGARWRAARLGSNRPS